MHPTPAKLTGMLLCLIAIAIKQSVAAPQIPRDDFGVPHIVASTWDEAFYDAGYATAQDRLWQMELSRRLARGQMAEVFGSKMAASDKEVLQFGYTDDELDKQFSGLSSKVQAAFMNYAKGVNAYIEQASSSKSLPKKYADNGFAPRAWTVEDSAAISVRLLQLFGRGGAGELRNLAVLTYLQSQPGVKGRAMDAFDDIAWENESSAITTMPSGEDPQAGSPPLKVSFTRAQTEAQLKSIPQMSLFELLPAIQLAEMKTSKLLAQKESVPYRTGSYCVVVSPERSSIGVPLLISGPQMGHSNPAIIHEISLSAPGISVEGMDIPGVPGVVIGMSPNLAWGLTSGVADTEDIFDFKGSGDNAYLYGGQTKQIETVHFTLKVKGEADRTVDQSRTIFGPVVLHALDHFFVRRSAYWGQEMKSVEAYYGLYDAKTPDEIEHSLDGATMNFNFFYATTSGHIGWMYAGAIPIRAEGIDPRFPTPAEPAFDWKGFLPPGQRPHIRDPKAGLLANWNNKPTSWWPNYDTPVWGRIFHNEVLLDQVHKPKLTAQDLELAVWNIARLDETVKYFAPYAKMATGDAADSVALSYLRAFDGRLMGGSAAATVYLYWLNALRIELFEGAIGNFYSPDLFQIAAQPSLMLKALERKTAVDYLGKRSAEQVASAAFARAMASLKKVKGPNIQDWGMTPGSFPVPDETPVPYSNRGSYIQVIELMSEPYGRNVLPPGESETGEHSKDQAPLARAWTYKRMKFGTGP